MKTVMITAPSSGSGKTLCAISITRAIKNRGLDVCAFKTGPDYIDTAYLKEASKKPAGNLDIHLMGREGIKKAFSMGEGDYCVIEGVMGYFDGIYNTYENSSFDISRELDVNAILVYTPKGEMFSAVPKIKGMAEFKGSKIKAVILNRVSESTYLLLKEKIQEYTELLVIGYIPDASELGIKSRHLGLIQSFEMENIDEYIDAAASIVEKYVDIDAVIKLMNEVPQYEINYPERRNIKVAVAMDKAFSFYYRENIKLLENTCDVEYFSPLEDKCIPKCDFVYIGGGYPEVFKEKLSLNENMMKSLRDYVEAGGVLYAECGGFMYLTGEIDSYKMAGIYKGASSMTYRLQRFGYINIELRDDCILGKKGDKITAHEFHKSITTLDNDGIFQISKAMGDKKWLCGHKYKNAVAGYPHINFIGNMGAFKSLLESIEKNKVNSFY